MPDWYNLFYGIWLSPSFISSSRNVKHICRPYWLSQSFNRHFNRICTQPEHIFRRITHLNRESYFPFFYFAPFSACFTLRHKNSNGNCLQILFPSANIYVKLKRVASTWVDCNQLTTSWKSGLKKLWFFSLLLSITKPLKRTRAWNALRDWACCVGK